MTPSCESSPMHHHHYLIITHYPHYQYHAYTPLTRTVVLSPTPTAQPATHTHRLHSFNQIRGAFAPRLHIHNHITSKYPFPHILKFPNFFDPLFGGTTTTPLSHTYPYNHSQQLSNRLPILPTVQADMEAT